MKVRRCDACGAIGEEPYEGWIVVATLAKEEYDDPDRVIAIRPSKRPLLSYEVCSHSCLPDLAFAKSAQFASAREEAAA